MIIFVSGATRDALALWLILMEHELEAVGPSIPVQVAGFSGLPEAGDYFEVVAKEEYLKAQTFGCHRMCRRVPFAKENAINYY